MPEEERVLLLLYTRCHLTVMSPEEVDRLLDQIQVYDPLLNVCAVRSISVEVKLPNGAGIDAVRHRRRVKDRYMPPRDGVVVQVIALLRSTRIDTNLVAHVKAFVRGAHLLVAKTYVALEDYVVLSLRSVFIAAD